MTCFVKYSALKLYDLTPAVNFMFLHAHFNYKGNKKPNVIPS
jgi:hypothetical protein